jgi:two-component system OmpR family sensor kinase
MSRLPIRLRLTLAFAAGTAALFATLAFLLVRHLNVSLDTTLDQGLRGRAADVAALVQQSDTGLREAQPSPVGGGESFAQVLDRRGRVIDETKGLGSRSLLDPRQLARARTAALLVVRARRAGVAVRLLAVPVRAQGERLVVVVGAPLATRDQALASLRGELLLGGPAALLATSLIAYLLAAAALRPVERMRVRAGTISERRLSERLPVPRTRDELARLGRTLNDLLSRVESGLSTERRFVADASHELRTPLALLRAEVELALEEPRGEDELRAALRSIGAEADRLCQLAEDLLLLARLDDGRLVLREEPLEAHALFEVVAARFERRAADASRAIVVGTTEARLRGDRLRLEQALANLVENALRHGGGDIELTAREASGTVELHVADHGPGFPAGFLPRAFHRFSRADHARSGAGAGLGLAIAAEVAAAHGGSAGATNRPAGGADTWLSLPAAPAKATLPELAASLA